MKLKGRHILVILLCYWLPVSCTVALVQYRFHTDGEGYSGTAVELREGGTGRSSFQDLEAFEFLGGYTERVMQRFDHSPLFITILYVVILYSILTLIVLLIIILLHRSRLQQRFSRIEYLKQEYQQKLMNYLFDDSAREQSLLDLQRIASGRFNRQVLIDQMIDLSVNLKGRIKEIIRELYLGLGLKEDSLKKAYSRKWHKNVKGFRELAFMNIREANQKIVNCLNSSNEILRMEAQITLVRLSDSDPYQFLHLMERPLSKWEQITLHELLIQHNLKVPAFREYFESENLSVLIFALDMASWFGQKEAEPDIIRLLRHRDDEVRLTVIRVCGDLKLQKSLQVLREGYLQEPYRNKLEILRTFAKIPEEGYLEFLKSVLDLEEDVQLQILATRAMENMDEPGISMLIKLMKSKSGYKNYQIIIRHVLDGRIY